MIELPEDIAIRMRWAEELIDATASAIAEYAATSPFTIEPERLPSTEPEYDLWTAVGRLHHPPPPRIALLASDAIQSIRSSLDYLARALVLTGGGTPVEGMGGTQFPIRAEDRGKPLRLAGSDDSEILRYLTELQPYRSDRPMTHPLTRLNILNNRSKHQVLPILVGAGDIPAIIALYYNAPIPTGVLAPYMRWFFDGDALHPLVLPAPPGTHPIAEAFVNTIVGFEANPWHSVSVVDELGFLHRYVAHYVIPTFRKFFAEPWPDYFFSSDELQDPQTELPQITPEHLVMLTRRMLDRLGGTEEARIMVLGLMPGVSAAMGYWSGGVPKYQPREE